MQLFLRCIEVKLYLNTETSISKIKKTCTFMYIMMEGGEKQKEWIILKNLSFLYLLHFNTSFTIQS